MTNKEEITLRRMKSFLDERFHNVSRKDFAAELEKVKEEIKFWEDRTKAEEGVLWVIYYKEHYSHENRVLDNKYFFTAEDAMLYTKKKLEDKKDSHFISYISEYPTAIYPEDMGETEEDFII
jgi:Ran GTPase-activating protein (RanGAP) involved in mRNA processing and transport